MSRAVDSFKPVAILLFSGGNMLHPFEAKTLFVQTWDKMMI
jgi:hypothetical protein